MGAEKIRSNGNNLALYDSSPAPTLAQHGYQPQPAPPPNDSILEIIWRQRNVVGIAVGVCLFLAVFYLLIATRYYSGYAQLYVRQSAPSINPTEPAPPQQDNDTFLFTQRSVIASTPVVAMTLGTPGIRDLKTFDGQDNLFAFLKNSLIIDVGKKDELISVQFDTPYKEDAQKVVSALVDSYINYQSKSRQTSASDVMASVLQERDKRQAELRRKQAELQAFRAQHGMVADEKTNVYKLQLDNLTAELTKAQLEAINAKTAWSDVERAVLNSPERKAAFESYRTSGAYSAPTAQDDASLRAQMLQAQATMQQLSTHYGPNHPVMKRLRDSIEQSNIVYAAEVFRRYETAQQHETDLKSSLAQQQTTAVANNATVIEEATLASDVTRLQSLLNDLDKRMKDFELTQGGSAISIQVLEPPSVSRAPTRPYTSRTLALALLGGLVLGCGGACVRDWYDYRLRSADEVKSTLGITVLGLIPHVGDENSPIARGQKIHIDPQSEAAEAYRTLRTAVYFGTKEGQARSILVTSPERGDGKSTMTSNLAISLAQAGRRTLLVDADLRAPMQDLIFGINGRTGLATVLQGKETIDNAVRHTGIENLDLLPAGVAARNPSELLNSPKFIEVLDQLIEKYDQVIIDSPPMLAVTDARIIAASADATLLVLRAGKSNRKLGELSIDGLFSVGAKVLGAVVNDIQRRSYRYYGSYGRYGYGNNGRTDRSQAYVPAGANGNGNGHEMYAVNVNSDDEEELAARSRLTSG